MRGVSACGTAVGAGLLLLACMTPAPPRRVEPTGFLEDYLRLVPVPAADGVRVYVSENAYVGHYGHVLLEPVTIWRTEDSNLAEIPEDELQRLADYLYAAIARELQLSFLLADRPGSDVLRVRVAITEAPRARVLLDRTSTPVPPARLLANALPLAAETHAFVGRAALELEVVDSLSGERLVAAVEERAGAKTLSGAAERWEEVYRALDHWAVLLRARLTEIFAH